MLSPKEIRKQLKSVVAAQLQPKGFAWRQSLLLRERSPEVHDWIALPHVVPDKNGPVYFSANIGIYVPQLHHLLQEIGYEVCPQMAPVFSTNIGYLTPDKHFTEWPFLRNEFSSDSAQQLCHRIIQFGLPFQERFTDLNSIYAGCQKYGFGAYNRVHLPVLKFLMGRSDEALSAAEQALQEHSGMDDAYAKHLTQALEKFLEYVHASSA